jgi:hypothetical protein
MGECHRDWAGHLYLDRGDRNASVAALRRGINLGITHINPRESDQHRR